MLLWLLINLAGLAASAKKLSAKLLAFALRKLARKVLTTIQNTAPTSGPFRRQLTPRIDLLRGWYTAI